MTQYFGFLSYVFLSKLKSYLNIVFIMYIYKGK